MNSTTNTHQLNPNAIGLCTLGRHIAAKGWLSATGGNLSIRNGEHGCLISSSGKDKGDLSPKDLLQIDWHAAELTTSPQPSQGADQTALQWRAAGPQRPSAETELHVAIYQLYPSTKAVLHTHSISATVLSRLCLQHVVSFQGYEMAKAIAGVTTHEHTLQLPLFDNTQHLPSLASALKETHQARQAEGGLPYGFLVRGHGLYVWGDSLDDAKRHLEAYEFLLACELEQLKIRSLG